MRSGFKRRQWAALIALYAWWLLLGGGYLRDYWRNPVVGGADGSGHVAVLHLYASHTYPDVQGWIPEFFCGMPFPVFYPPLFYWLGATLMKLGGLDAAAAAKILTTFSFVSLPAALFALARRHGLSLTEASVAVAWAGVIACGSNAASLGGIGILGLFEVGLYTQTLGFVWFALWCGALPHARRTRASALLALASLTALILTNVHVLPLAAAFGASWWIFEARRIYTSSSPRGRKELLRHALASSVWYVVPALISAIWLLPLVAWYSYSVGEPLTAPRLLGVLGPLNLIWPACGMVAWWERERRPALAALCVALLLAAAAALTPAGGALPDIPLQAWRLMSSAVILCTLPLSVLVIRSLNEVIPGQPWVRRGLLLLSVFVLAGIHPRQQLSIASLAPQDGARIERIRAAFRDLPPGRTLVEIVHPDAVFNSKAAATRDLAVSRALTNRLAMDGRPVLWCVFREHAVTAPLAIATSNLFSTTREHFGIDGVALQSSVSRVIGTDDALRLARHLGVTYYLLRTEEQVGRLNNAPSVRLLWTIDGWSLFADRVAASPTLENVASIPVLAWMPARFKSRYPEIPDLFNLGEQLAFNGHPDVCVLWASSAGTNPWQLISRLPSTIVLISPQTLPSRDEWRPMLAAHGAKLKVLLLDDGSPPATEVDALREGFADYRRLQVNEHQPPGALIAEIARQIIHFQTQPDTPTDSALWRTSQTYFPTWRTSRGEALWLTGQGGMAALGDQQPSLAWHNSKWRPASMTLSVVGVLLAVLTLVRRPDPSDR